MTGSRQYFPPRVADIHGMSDPKRDVFLGA